MDQVIAFATLFLGLVTGPQEIRLSVGHEVARVELTLDGDALGSLEGEPWLLEWDAGEQLLPHRLVAIAHDDGGRELGRAEQWINLPRSAAEVEVLLSEPSSSDRGAVHGGRTARLSWQSLVGSSPQWATAWLDEQPLEVTDPRQIVLPSVDMNRVHVLRVELGFDEEVTASTEVTFGGVYLDRVQTELTALPISVGKKAPTLTELEGRVTSGSETLRVVAIEKGPIDVIVVRDAGAVEALRAFLSREARAMRGGNKSLTNVSTEGRLKRLLPIEAGAHLRFVWPREDEAAGADQFALFPHSQELDNRQGGLAWLIALMAEPEELSERQRLADAVAVAGMSAVRRNRRRAVLLILGPEPRDQSRLSVEAARRYLEVLRVPLLVWSVVAPDGGDQPWGESADISSASRWRRAAAELWQQVLGQRLLWVEGRHLPQALRYSVPVTDIRER